MKESIKKTVKKLFKLVKTTFFIMLPVLLAGMGADRVYAEDAGTDTLVIVLDPGHGGENLGAEYEDYTEKDMTMIVARAMKEELEKYEGVTVYLTRETDKDMSIRDRALFAKEKNADFLFCLHFNMSVKHDLFGAEVWVPAENEFYKKGYAYAQLQMEEMTGLGLYSRGIKTKLNDQDTNYYGILRYCTEQGIPSVLVEHCHLDQSRDQGFYQEGEEQLKLFGRLDAEAAAKYFGLSSKELGVDYSDYHVEEPEVSDALIRPDESAPEVCELEVTAVDENTGEASVIMHAEDADSYILYYSYSTDGGNSYSELQEWPRPERWDRSADTCSFKVQIPFDNDQVELRVCAYNSFDVWTESGIIPLAEIPDPERLKREALAAEEEARRQAQESYEEITYASGQGENGMQDAPGLAATGLLIGLILIFMLILTFFLVKWVMRLGKGKRKR